MQGNEIAVGEGSTTSEMVYKCPDIRPEIPVIREIRSKISEVNQNSLFKIHQAVNDKEWGT